MPQYCALLSIVFLIPVVFLFDGIHRRNLNYRRLWEMFEGLKTLGKSR